MARMVLQSETRYNMKKNSLTADKTKMEYLRKTAGGTQFHFVTVYKVGASYSFPEHFDLTEHRGVICCEIIRQEEDAAQLFVYVYWISPSAFKAKGRSIEQSLGLVSPLWKGHHVESRVKSSSWWRPLSPYTLIPTIVGLTAICGFLYTVFLKTMPEPKFKVELAAPSPMNILEGHPFELPIEVTNTMLISTSAVVAYVDHDKIRVSAEGALEFPEERIVVPAVLMGLSETLRVIGLASGAGDYKIEVPVSGNAGWFRRSVKKVVDCQLKVWKEEEIKKVHTEFGSDGRTLSLECMIKVGVSCGSGALEALAKLPDPGDVGFVDILSDDARIDKMPPTNKPDGARQGWLVRVKQSFESIPCVLMLESAKPKTKEEWREIADKVEFKLWEEKDK